ncbi:DEAD/DEAH box helicase [Streptomyces prasinus]|uniref:DEAD/DEAH box helicase n=1 Tax=Streptomyces prasinus TaxID=67345 RepID=UPI00368020E8
MQFTLKDYQVDAVGEVLANLRDAKDDFCRKGRRVAFSLTATTGAGKTVMAAAVLEALFEGNDDFGIEADKSATVLWFTDDPALNEQTRFRLLEAAGDRLPYSRFQVIENSFNQEKLEAGKVYFLNSQKLAKGNLLVKGEPENGTSPFEEIIARPDMRLYTMWDTLRNTIEDENLTLIVILDEAHRGMKKPSKADASEKQTIVRRLINGGNGVAPVPIVWGISATVERFNVAMGEAENRTTYAPIVVDPARVQASGLLKDDIRIDFPVKAGAFDSVLLARATRKMVESTLLWREYAEEQGSTADPVVPLMILQVPNTPSREMLLNAVATIRDEWPGLPSDAIAHVFGDRSILELGGIEVPYIRPEQVQDSTRVRVLLAKDAISTGWDCPRAELLISFRPARDETHITQLLGRMVRSPLARRIPGNDRLNAVDCLLPFFDKKTVQSVAAVLLGEKNEGEDGSGGTGGGSGRRVLVAPVDMKANAAVPDSVWELLEELPSQSLPKKAAKPIKRLTALAHALTVDKLQADAGKDAHRELFAILDGLVARHRVEVNEAMKAILAVQGETIIAGMQSNGLNAASFTEVADDRVIEEAFRSAGRAFTLELARKYADHLAGPDDAESGDDGLRDAHLQIAALALVEGAKESLEEEAKRLVTKWLTRHRVAIKDLDHDRQAVYNELISQATEPQRLDILRPKVRTEETVDADGELLPTRPLHLLSDSDGKFPVGSLNAWEIQVVDTELSRNGVIAWYRNPSRATQDALAVAYVDGKGKWRQMCPDFIFFSEGSDASVRASIVDPHGTHLADAMPKLCGLADFAETFGSEFHRIEAVAQTKDKKLRVLDLTKESVRSAIKAATDAEALYLSEFATEY